MPGGLPFVPPIVSPCRLAQGFLNLHGESGHEKRGRPLRAIRRKYPTRLHRCSKEPVDESPQRTLQLHAERMRLFPNPDGACAASLGAIACVQTPAIALVVARAISPTASPEYRPTSWSSSNASMPAAVTRAGGAPRGIMLTSAASAEDRLADAVRAYQGRMLVRPAGGECLPVLQQAQPW